VPCRHGPGTANLQTELGDWGWKPNPGKPDCRAGPACWPSATEVALVAAASPACRVLGGLVRRSSRQVVVTDPAATEPEHLMGLHTARLAEQSVLCVTLLGMFRRGYPSRTPSDPVVTPCGTTDAQTVLPHRGGRGRRSPSVSRPRRSRRCLPAPARPAPIAAGDGLQFAYPDPVQLAPAIGGPLLVRPADQFRPRAWFVRHGVLLTRRPGGPSLPPCQPLRSKLGCTLHQAHVDFLYFAPPLAPVGCGPPLLGRRKISSTMLSRGCCGGTASGPDVTRQRPAG
jgi:hypothetical protein